MQPSVPLWFITGLVVYILFYFEQEKKKKRRKKRKGGGIRKKRKKKKPRQTEILPSTQDPKSQSKSFSFFPEKNKNQCESS